jgi:hypothetical protein
MSGFFGLYKQEALKGTYPLATDNVKGMLVSEADMTSSSKFRAITAATNASPSVLTVAGTPPANGDRLTIKGAIGNTAINGRWKVTGLSGNTFQLADIISGAAVNGNGTFSGTCTFWNLSTNQFVSDIDSAARISSSGNATSKTFTLGVLSFAVITFSAVTSGKTCPVVMLYDDTPATVGAKPLIGVDDAATGLPVLANGGDITYTPNASGFGEI